MREPLRLTNSEMSTWRECKRKWWLSNVRGLALRSRVEWNRPLSIGNRVHEALEAYYDPALRQDPLENLEESIARDIAEFPSDEKEIRQEGDLAKIMLEGYVQWLAEEGADSDFEPTDAAEEALEVPLVDGVTLLTKLDVRVRDRIGDKWTLDHKTGAYGVEPLLLQQNTQALTQHLAEYLRLVGEDRRADRAKGTIFNFLKKVKRTARAKPPFYWREEVRHSKEELRSHWYHVVAIAEEIRDAERRLEAGENHQTVAYPSPTGDCKWKCPYFRICNQFDDGSDVEGAIADLYIEGTDPLERYARKEEG